MRPAGIFAQADPTTLADWIPSGIAALATIAIVAVVRWLLRRSDTIERAETTFRIQMATVALVLVGLLTVILVLPESLDSELAFSVVGLVVTGALAISSQSIIANAMAGLMLRSVSSFKPGDFIEVDEQMGRVSELGLFHTEIQTADRDLITLPNSLMVNRPVRVVRSSGTIVSAQVSIGYDVSQHELESLFIEAAEAADLVEPFVQVVDLGDHSVTYRVAGFLPDPRSLLASRSKLRRQILDTLSEGGIEIMSPVYIARRAVGEQPVIPRWRGADAANEVRPSSEDRVFDKAEAAGQIEAARADLADAVENLDVLRIESSSADPDTRPRIEAAISRQEHRIEQLERRIERLNALREEI